MTVFTHDPADTLSISSNEVNFIFQDSRGSVWFSTRGGGVNRYLPRLNGFSRYLTDSASSNSLGGNDASAIYEDKRGELWIGAGGLNRFDRNTDSFVRYPANSADPHSLASPGITFLLEDAEGTFWVGTTRGLHTFDRDRGIFHRCSEDPALPSTIRNGRLTAVVDADSALWIASMGDGLLLFEKKTGRVVQFRHDPRDPASLGEDNISELIQDKRGRLWVGTWDHAGLNMCDPGIPGPLVFHQYARDTRDPGSLSENRIYAIVEDIAGNLWIGTRNGLNKVRHSRKFLRELEAEQVSDILEDKRGRLWVSTLGSGISVLNGQGQIIRKILPRDSSTGRGTHIINALFEDCRGTIWAGGYKDGVFSIDPFTFSVARYPFSDQGNGDPEVFERIFELECGTVLVDCESGLYRVGKRTVDRIEEKKKSFLTDHAGSVWQFDQTGFRQVENGSPWRRSHSYDSLLFPSSLALAVTGVVMNSQQHVWISARGWGLVRVDLVTDSARRYTTKDGLPHDHITNLAMDQEGILWIATVNGLSRFDPTRSTFRTYTVNDGLPANSFSGNRGYRTRSGDLVFGTTAGLVRFDPIELRPMTARSAVVLTGFQVLHQPWPFEGDVSDVNEIEITYRENVFSFEVATLDLSDPGSNTYVYHMEGFDQDWISAGTRRYFTYTNLNPGSYTFRVRGRNGDGVWNHDGVAVHLTISPPFWFTWWFMTGIASLIVGGVIYLHRWRLERRKEVEHTRDRIARDLHDDVASTLGSIALYSATLRKEVGSSHLGAHDLLDRIGRLSTEAVDTLGDIVWSVSPDHDEPGDFLTHVSDHLSQTCTSYGIQYDLNIVDKGVATHLDQLARKNLYLIYKEALRNVVRHAAASQVWVRVETVHDTLLFTVRDDGRGFAGGVTGPSIDQATNEPIPARGHGLRNMKRRAAELGARLTVESGLGAGTTVTVRLKMT